MKKIDIVNSNENKNNENDYRKFVAKNVKLTSYDKVLMNYIIRVINKEIM